MKKYIFPLISIIILFVSCEKDNYDAPNAFLTGKIVYNGETMQLKHNEITMRLYEPGWELSNQTYMNIHVAQDGTFSSNIFSGKTYKLIRVANVGPWENPTVSDTITIMVKGNTEIEVPVKPYFTVSSATASYDMSSRIVSAVFSVDQHDATKDIEHVGLYVSSTRFVDANTIYNDKCSKTIAGASLSNLQNISIALDNALPSDISYQEYMFVRVGVKTVGCSQLIYSEPMRVDVK